MTLPRSGQTSDWIKYLPTVPEMAEITVCAWVIPFHLSGNSHPISYASTISDNNILLELTATHVKVGFTNFYTFNDGPTKINEQVIKLPLTSWYLIIQS